MALKTHTHKCDNQEKKRGVGVSENFSSPSTTAGSLQKAL
jgi:hypothetical protein